MNIEEQLLNKNKQLEKVMQVFLEYAFVRCDTHQNEKYQFAKNSIHSVLDNNMGMETWITMVQSICEVQPHYGSKEDSLKKIDDALGNLWSEDNKQK